MGLFLLVRGGFAGRFTGMNNKSVSLWGLLVGGMVLGAGLAHAAGKNEPEVGTAPGDMAGAVSAYLRGSMADLAGNPAVASKSYLSALAEDPDNITLRERVLELTLMGGDIPTAIRLAHSLPEAEQNTMSRLVLTMDDAHKGKIKDARKEMRRVAKSAPGLLQFELVRVYLDYADGAKVAKLAADLEKLPVPASLAGRRDFHVARLWLKAGKPEEAKAILERAQAKEPNAIFTTLLLAQVYVQQGEPDKAEALVNAFRAANEGVALVLPTGADLAARKVAPFSSTLDEDLAASMFDFSLVVWSEGGLAPARQLMNLALWLAPEKPYYRYYSGILLEMGGDFTAAAEVYKALADNPDMAPGVRVRLAEVKARMGEREEGWKEISALLKEYPDAAPIHRSAAQLAFENDDFRRAAKEYTWLLEKLPLDATVKARAELLFARGAAYERGHDDAKAEADLKRVLELDPANAQVLNYLGYMWVDRGEHLDEAMELLKKAHLLAPDDGPITDSLGWAYFRTGELDLAVKYLELAVEQDPESAEIADHLGDAYAKAGRGDEAKKFWRLALELVDKGGEVPFKGFREKVERKVK